MNKPIMTTCPTCGTPQGVLDQVHDLCVGILLLKADPTSVDDVQGAIDVAREYLRDGIQHHAMRNFYGGTE
jgi:hypothetical protein